MSAKALNLPNMLSLVRVFLAPLVLLFLSIRISGTVPFLQFLEDDPPTWGDVLGKSHFFKPFYNFDRCINFIDIPHHIFYDRKGTECYKKTKKFF